MQGLHTHWHTPADPTGPGGLMFWLEDGNRKAEWLEAKPARG